MKKIEELRRYFTKGERALWFGSVFVIIAAFYFFDRSNYFTLFASLLGVTSLIFNAKGNPFGQLLMILFSLLYGIISFTFSYYGEMLRQHRTIAEASAVESPIRQETIGFPAHFFARAHNFKPPGRACQPEADSPMRT